MSTAQLALEDQPHLLAIRDHDYSPPLPSSAAALPPPPPPPSLRQPNPPKRSGASVEDSTNLRDLIGKKKPEAEPMPDLTLEQLAKSLVELPKEICPRCQAPIIQGGMAEHANSHSSLIIPNLYLGGMRNAHNKKELVTRTNIKHIVNVAEEVENVFEQCKQGCMCSNGTAHDDGLSPDAPALFTYHTMKIKDAIGEDALGLFDKAYDAIHSAIESNEPVLVHCVAGISRSASVCIAYLMRAKRWSLRKAFEHVKAARSIVSPIAWFVLQLQNYEYRLGEQMVLEGYHGQPTLLMDDVYPAGTRFILSSKASVSPVLGFSSTQDILDHPDAQELCPHPHTVLPQ